MSVIIMFETSMGCSSAIWRNSRYWKLIIMRYLE